MAAGGIGGGVGFGVVLGVVALGVGDAERDPLVLGGVVDSGSPLQAASGITMPSAAMTERVRLVRSTALLT